jgi:hypothetical protein
MLPVCREGDTPPAPQRSFAMHWLQRCEGSWRRAFLLFGAGIPTMFANLAVAAWIKFASLVASVLTTVVMVASLAFMAYFHRKWTTHILATEQLEQVGGAGRVECAEVLLVGVCLKAVHCCVLGAQQLQGLVVQVPSMLQHCPAEGAAEGACRTAESVVCMCWFGSCLVSREKGVFWVLLHTWVSQCPTCCVTYSAAAAAAGFGVCLLQEAPHVPTMPTGLPFDWHLKPSMGQRLGPWVGPQSSHASRSIAEYLEAQPPQSSAGSSKAGT